MPRFALALLALVLVAPVAAAEPIAAATVRPADAPPEWYYLRVTLWRPEAPRTAEADDDCAAGHDAPGPGEAAATLAHNVSGWRPAEDPSMHAWFPECVATDTDEVLPGARASYDVRSGRYFVDASAPSSGVPMPFPTTQVVGPRVILTGTTGAGAEADCELCPPPGL